MTWRRRMGAEKSDGSMLVPHDEKSNCDPQTLKQNATTPKELTTTQGIDRRGSLAIRNPDIFHLRGVFQKPASFGEL